MAVGNTFGATALSSYGGFWLSFAVILTPGGFNIEDEAGTEFANDFGLFLMVSILAITTKLDSLFSLNSLNARVYPLANNLTPQGWFIFTTIMLIATLRSTIAFFSLFFTLDMAFLLLGIGYLEADAAGPKISVIKAGGVFGLLAAFLAWYNALAGILDDTNRYVYRLATPFHIAHTRNATISLQGSLLENHV